MAKKVENNQVYSAKIENIFKNQDNKFKKKEFNKLWAEVINLAEREKIV